MDYSLVTKMLSNLGFKIHVMTLITIEGIDGSGKSTVLDEMIEKNSDDRIVFTQEPFEGEKLRDIIEGKENKSEISTFFYFMADHSEHVEKLIGPELKNNNLVISDRYIHSRLAYQSESLKSYFTEDVLCNWIENIHEPISIKPDLVILLDVSVETALSRQETDDIFERKEFLQNVRDNYMTMAENNDNFTLVNSRKSKESVYRECRKTINQYLEDSEHDKKDLRIL